MQSKPSLSPRIIPHGPFRVRVLLALVRHHWFIRLRWIIAFVTVALLLIERLHNPEFQRPHAVALCVGVLAIVNVVWTLIGRDLAAETNGAALPSPAVVRRVTAFANAQMTMDLLILTVILRYSGGVENPMAVFYLFHMLIATLLLKPLNALLQGSWALLLYGGLAIGECGGFIGPHYPFLSSTAHSQLHADWSFVRFRLAVLAAGIFGTMYFTHQISWRLDDQELELHDANEALRRSQVAIQDLQARRSRFMLTAAHQLKGPLAGIETLAALIRDKVAAPEALDGIIGRIIGRCQQAIAQVSELLTLARVQEGAQTRHQSADTEVVQVIKKVVEAFAEQAKSKRLELRVDLPGSETAQAAVEARDLENCVSNLLDNAIKYTPEGGSIRIKASWDAESVSISVKDTGMGIAEDSEDDLFDPFRRGNLALAANIPGSGLGLAIVREVVEQANGRIEVRSAVGQGSEFILSFPKHDALAAVVRRTRTTSVETQA